MPGIVHRSGTDVHAAPSPPRPRGMASTISCRLPCHTHPVLTAATTRHRTPAAPRAAVGAAAPLVGRDCDVGSEGDSSQGGFCRALDRRTAEQYLQQLEGWQLAEDHCGRLHLQRQYHVESFVKALSLCSKIAAVAEAEGHYPELHLTDWNRLTVSIWTRARNGITENDAILASKLDRINKKDLLQAGRKKKTAAEV